MRIPIVLSVFSTLLLSAAAGAEDTPTTDAAAMPDIVVTGSRLGAMLPEAQPVTTIRRQEILASGVQSLGDLLQALPFMSGAPLGTTVNARGNGGGQSRGIETVELRGLGPERTLILVDGQRFLPGGNGVGGIADLGMIPIAVIERVEVLKTGASVEYGADAVAGVVNVITRRQTSGLELAADYGVTDRGDGDTVNLSAVHSGELGQGRFLLGGSLFEQASVGKGERGFSRQILTVDGPDNTVVPDGSSAPANGNYRTSNGRLTLIEGRSGASAEDFRSFVGNGPDNDRFNYNPFEDLVQDSRRLSVFGHFEQDLSADLALRLDGFLQHRDSDTALAPLPFFTNRLDGVNVAADNIYNPFGEDLSDVRKRLFEAGNRGFTQDNRAWRLRLGLSGALGDWHWDADYAYGRNRVIQQQLGDLRRDRLALALGPSFRDAQGQAVCGTADTPIADCVPLNVFGAQGAITPDMLAYLQAGQLTDRSENTQQVLNLNLRGVLASLPAGDLKTAFGYEFRREEGEDVPDVQTQAGNTTGVARSVTRGAIEAHEIYAEVGVPLTAKLELEFGGRAVHFSNFDESGVLDAALRYEAMEGLVARLNASRAFRAPTIGELFGGLAQSNPAVDDPCADFSRLSDVQVERCVAQGVPADGSFDQTGNETPQLGGGNAQLRPETSDILTAGISWHPSGLPGFHLDLDVYSIEIDDAIASLGANTILEQCLATGAAQFCDSIDRDGSGAIIQVRSALQNIASETAQGIDLQLRYAHEMASGRLAHKLMFSHVLERDVQAFPGARPFVGAGEFDPDQFGAIPENKASYAASWRRAAWELGYQLQWIDSLTERGGELAPGTVNRASERFYHDLSVFWNAGTGLQMGLAVNNLLDRDPPFLVNGDVANTDVSTYRLLGRRFKASLQYNF